MDFKHKYLKYKNKYLALKGGMDECDSIGQDIKKMFISSHGITLGDFIVPPNTSVITLTNVGKTICLNPFFDKEILDFLKSYEVFKERFSQSLTEQATAFMNKYITLEIHFKNKIPGQHVNNMLISFNGPMCGNLCYILCLKGTNQNKMYDPWVYGENNIQKLLSRTTHSISTSSIYRTTFREYVTERLTFTSIEDIMIGKKLKYLD